MIVLARQVIVSCITALLSTVVFTQNLFASQAIKLCRNNLVVINTQTNQLEKSIPLPFEGWSVGTYPDPKMLAVYPVYKYKYNLGTDSENILFNTEDLTFTANDKLLQTIYDRTNVYVKNELPDPNAVEKFASIGLDKGNIVVMNSSQPDYVIDYQNHKLYMMRQTSIEVLDTNDPSKEVEQIHLGFHPLQMAINPSKNTIYIIGNHYIGIIGLLSHHYSYYPYVGLNFHFIAVRPDGKETYITASTEDPKNNRTIGHLLIFDSTGVRVKENALYNNWRPHQVVFTPDSKKAIITDADDSYFFILSTELDDSTSSWGWEGFSGTDYFKNPQKITVPSWIQFGRTPISLINPVISPEGMVYFSLLDSGNVITYNLKSGSFSKIDTTAFCNCSNYFACNSQPVVLSK